MILHVLEGDFPYYQSITIKKCTEIVKDMGLAHVSWTTDKRYPVLFRENYNPKYLFKMLSFIEYLIYASHCAMHMI